MGVFFFYVCGVCYVLFDVWFVYEGCMYSCVLLLFRVNLLLCYIVFCVCSGVCADVCSVSE